MVTGIYRALHVGQLLGDLRLQTPCHGFAVDPSGDIGLRLQISRSSTNANPSGTKHQERRCCIGAMTVFTTCRLRIDFQWPTKPTTKPSWPRTPSTIAYWYECIRVWSYECNIHGSIRSSVTALFADHTACDRPIAIFWPWMAISSQSR